MLRTLVGSAALLVLAGFCSAADTKLSVKVEAAAAPKELAEPVRAVLDGQAMSVFDEKGKLICTVWARKSLESKATAGEAKAGLKYSQFEETTIVGAVKFPETWIDYRKQKIKPGVYTLRLAVQPMDGDHMGTAPYNEFCLPCPAEHDKTTDLLEVDKLHELSAKSVGRKHPGMMLLFPLKTPPEKPAIEARPKEHVVLSFRVPATAGGEKTALGISLVIVGATMAE
jgi:hypothetical protein